MDSKNRIARSNVYAVFGRILAWQIKSNKDYEVLFAKAGLKDRAFLYEDYLTPYTDNGYGSQENRDYNPEYACLSLGEELEATPDVLMQFFNTILDDVDVLPNPLLFKLQNYLNELGFELKVEHDDGYMGCKYKYRLIPLSQGVIERKKDLDLLSSELEKMNPDLLALYNEALKNYGSGNYCSCIDNCRSLFESYFKQFDQANNNYAKGILAVTKEQVVENGKILSKKEDIFGYWLNNRKGANRYRLFVTLYSVMSGLGTHREEVATSEDALMLLRFTEDVLIWCFKKY